MKEEVQNQKNSYEEVIKKQSTSKSVVFNFKKTWTAYVVFAIMIIISFILYRYVQKSTIAEIQTEFDKSCASVVNRIQNQYDKLDQVILSTQGLYYENMQVVRDYFELYGAVPVKTYSHIMSICFAPKVLNSQWAEFHYNALSQGYWTFDLHPKGVRDYYYPAEHIVDYEKNKHRLAFDYATEDNINQAIDIAKRENKHISSKFYNIRPDTLSFAIVAPIYHKNTDFSTPDKRETNFFGSLIMEIDAKDFFTTALKGTDINTFPTDTSLIFCFEDENNIVYKSANSYIMENNKEYVPTVSSKLEINFSNRKLKANFYSTPNFVSPIQANAAIAVLLISLLISVIAFLLIISLITQKSRAEEIAEKMTASQRRILDTSKDIIAAISMTGEWLSMNPASLDILGVEPKQMIGTKITDYFKNLFDIKIWQDIVDAGNEENRVDLQLNTKTPGEYKWISWQFTISKIDNVIYAIGRDITIEKQIENEQKLRSKQIELAEIYGREATASKNNIMIKLNHTLRNQLTGILGYVQLIADKTYDTQEELDMYIEFASESLEHAFTYISDSYEAALGDITAFNKMVVLNLQNTLDEALKLHFTTTQEYIKINYLDNADKAHFVAEKDIVVEIFESIVQILKTDFNIAAIENTYEGVTEITIEAKVAKSIAQTFDMFNKNQNNIIDVLKYDDDDILITIAKISSYIKTMLGMFKLEVIDDVNNIVYIFITFPLVEKLRMDP
ncbi:MAG: PAS domain S-box protein [Ignavibacteria bacterium]|jgi:PAS domain S-box-containing protein|nr:PAS domain S-box protein [Ignavibacteria bacterium]